MNWLNTIVDIVVRLITAWVTGKQQVEKGVTEAKLARAEDDLKVVAARVEQKKKVDDEVDRLTDDARRERLRAWSRTSKHTNGH